LIRNKWATDKSEGGIFSFKKRSVTWSAPEGEVIIAILAKAKVSD